MLLQKFTHSVYAAAYRKLGHYPPNDGVSGSTRRSDLDLVEAADV